MPMRLLSQQKVRRISFRYHDPPLYPPPVLEDADHAYQLLYPSFRPHMQAIEAVRLLLLNHSMRVKGVVTIARGGINSCTIDPRIVFGVCLATLSSGFVIAHNHPSGDLTPSYDDRMVTERLIQGGQLLDIRVHDHIILADDSFVSFRDRGLI